MGAGSNMIKKIKPVECPYCWRPLTKNTVEMARHFKYLEDQILLWRLGWQQVSPQGIKMATAKLKRLKKLITKCTFHENRLK